MTALVLNTIPSSINSYERLAVWVMQALQSANASATVRAVDTQAPVPAAAVSVGVIADGTPRFILQAYVPCDLNGLNSSSAKTWMAANDISTAAPNVVFGSN